MTPLEEAKQLLASAQTETQLRTVASRGYFAAYTRVVSLAVKIGFRPAGSGDDHKNLFAFLKNHRNSLLVRMGVRLGTMRSLRNRADYDMLHFFSEGFARNVVSDAEQVESWAKIVEAALPPSEAANLAPGALEKPEPKQRAQGKA